MQLHKIDFHKVSSAIVEKYGRYFSASYLSQVQRGKLKSEATLIMVNNIVYQRGKLKKEFVNIDFRAVAAEIAKETGVSYPASVLRSIHENKPKGSETLTHIERILKNAK